MSSIKAQKLIFCIIFFVFSTSLCLAQQPTLLPEDFLKLLANEMSGEMAFKMAEIAVDDIDACEIYDCFTYTVEITLQDYGFFGPGEGEDWFQEGTIEPGGRMPVNTSGGQLSEAYAMGLTQLTEAVMQLMDRCEERQLGPKTNTKKPEIIMCSDNGGILQSHSCAILRRS